MKDKPCVDCKQIFTAKTSNQVRCPECYKVYRHQRQYESHKHIYDANRPVIDRPIVNYLYQLPPSVRSKVGRDYSDVITSPTDGYTLLAMLIVRGGAD